MTSNALARGPDAWFARATSIADDVVAALGRYGVRPDPALRLVPSPSPFPYYEPSSLTIGFGLPDVTTIKGRMYWYYFQTLFGAADLAEVASAVDAMLPCLMAHELAHHLRHAYHAPIDSDFVEEQIANLIAIAFLHDHPVHRATLADVHRWSTRMLARGKARLEEDTLPLSRFRLDVGDVLLARGQVSRTFLDEALALAADAEVAPERVFAAMGIPIEQVDRAHRDRAELAEHFNRTYMSDLAQYWLFGSEWLVTYLERDPPPSLGPVLDRHLLGAEWELGRRDAVRTLVMEAFRGPDTVLAAAAVEALGELDGVGAAQVLASLDADERAEVRDAAQRTRARLTETARTAGSEDAGQSPEPDESLRADADVLAWLRRQEDRGAPPSEASWRALAARALRRARTLRSLEAAAARHPSLEMLQQAISEERRRAALVAVRAARHGSRALLDLGDRGLASRDPAYQAIGLRVLTGCLGGRAPAYRAALRADLPRAPEESPEAVCRRVLAGEGALLHELAAAARSTSTNPPPDGAPMLTTIEKLMYLRAVPTFAALEIEALRALADVAITVVFRTGEAILTEGDVGDCLYVITDGRVELRLRGAGLGELGARQHFGEMSLFDGGARSATVCAVRDTTLLRLDRADFLRLGHRYSEIFAGVVAVLSQRLRDANALG